MIIIDDLMLFFVKDLRINDLFIEGSFYRNLLVIVFN